MLFLVHTAWKVAGEKSLFFDLRWLQARVLFCLLLLGAGRGVNVLLPLQYKKIGMWLQFILYWITTFSIWLIYAFKLLLVTFGIHLLNIMHTAHRKNELSENIF